MTSSPFKFSHQGGLVMIIPRQRIESIDNNHNELLVKIYDFEKLTPYQIEEIIQTFKNQIVNLPLAFVKIFINVSPLDNFFCNYVIFIKFNNATVIYSSVLAFGRDMTLGLKGVLINFAEKIGDNLDQIISDKDIEEDDDDEDDDDDDDDDEVNPINEPVDIDKLIAEIEKDRHQKEGEQ